MKVCTIRYLWKIGCANEPEIHQGFLKAGRSLSTDQLAHNYFLFLKAYLRCSLIACLSELHFPSPLWALFIICRSCLPLLQTEAQGSLDQTARHSGTFTAWGAGGRGSLAHSAHQVSAQTASATGASPTPFLLPLGRTRWLRAEEQWRGQWLWDLVKPG